MRPIISENVLHSARIPGDSCVVPGNVRRVDPAPLRIPHRDHGKRNLDELPLHG